jgi:hypothetical protein
MLRLNNTKLQLHLNTKHKRDKVIGGWRKLHNEEPHNLHSSPNTVGMIKLKKMRWAGHVTRLREIRKT